MFSLAVTVIIGLICITLGISHTKGNLSSLHSYHVERVKEEDKIPFGKRVGLGTIIIGIGLIIFGALTYAAELSGNGTFATVGTAVLIVFLIIGLIFAFSAMIKYNKGIF